MDIGIRSWIATVLFFLLHTGLGLLNQVFDRKKRFAVPTVRLKRDTNCNSLLLSFGFNKMLKVC